MDDGHLGGFDVREPQDKAMTSFLFRFDMCDVGCCRFPALVDARGLDCRLWIVMSSLGERGTRLAQTSSLESM